MAKKPAHRVSSFQFFDSYFDGAEMLENDDEKGRLFFAIATYVFSGIDLSDRLSDKGKIAFSTSSRIWISAFPKVKGQKRAQIQTNPIEIQIESELFQIESYRNRNRNRKRRKKKERKMRLRRYCR